jgi:hypothetical protein
MMHLPHGRIDEFIHLGFRCAADGMSEQEAMREQYDFWIERDGYLYRTLTEDAAEFMAHVKERGGQMSPELELELAESASAS